MKLLFYIHAITGGGGERVLATLVNAFAKQGNEVHLATNLNVQFVYEISENVILHNLHEGQNDLVETIKSLKLRCNIRSIARDVRPDVIVAFMSALGCSTIFSTMGLGIPVVVSEHTNIARFKGTFLDFKRRILYRFASAVTVLTRHDLRLWREQIRNAVYMPNPIDYNEMPPELHGRRKVVLAVGRVKQWKVKGFDNLLKSWGKICNIYPDWKLLIAGEIDTDSKVTLTRIAEENGCINYDFLGFRKDVKTLMMQSEVFCLSSRVEGLPMALIEAMNAGCCCVSFDVETGPREIIANETSGLIVNDQDIEDLASKLSEVLGNSELRYKLASNSYPSVEKYSTPNIVKRWNLLFEIILNR